MKAIIRSKAGKEFAGMEVQGISPAPLERHALRIKMASSRINPVDMDLMKGMPFLKYKNPQIGGIDGAGEVTEVGAGVQGFQKGDRVFFYRQFSDIGTWAEEITLPASAAAHIPSGMELFTAGAIALPLLTAYESILRCAAQAGERILIHGAGGGVGFQAVQVAHAMGLRVIATTGPRDIPALKAAGVEQIINYREHPFEEVLKPGDVDLVFDVLGKEILLQSIGLRPRMVVSLVYVDPSQLHKTGIKMPGLLKWLMRLAMGKYRRAAKKAGVKLLGQVTGANGKLLQAASGLLEEHGFQLRDLETVSLEEVEKRGLGKGDVGKVLVFGKAD